MLVLGTVLACTGVGSGLGMVLLAGALAGGGGSLMGQKAANPDGPIDWGKFAKDSAIGAVSNLLGWGVGKALAKAAPAAMQFASNAGQGGYNATQSAIKAAISPVGREAIEAGSPGAFSNVADYVNDEDIKDKTMTGVFHADTTGFVASAGFGAASSKLSNYVPAVIPMPPAGQHAAPRSGLSLAS